MEHPVEPLLTYKDHRMIKNSSQLPIPSSERISTDIFCTVVTSVFAIVMLAIAIFSWNITQLQQITYPTDQVGRGCTIDNPQFSYLYFTSFTDPSKRLCLTHCPKGNQTKLECWPTPQLSCNQNSNPKFQVSIYPTTETETSLGLFCQPNNIDINNKILENAGLLQKFNFIAAFRAIGVSALAAIGLGFFYVIVMTLVPGIVTYGVISVGGIGCITVAILVVCSNSQYISNYSRILAVYKVIIYFICAFMIVIGIFILWSLIKHQHDIQLSITFVKYATKYLWQFPQLLFAPLIFLLLTFGLIALFSFQTFAYWSHGQIEFNPNLVYYQTTGTFSTIMTVLNVIELIWGLCFLKESFNFLISATTIKKYFTDAHSIRFAVGNLFRFHWGSVAGGSFLLNFLYPLDLIYGMLAPTPSNQCCYNSYLRACSCCDRVFDLAKSQSMAMINILGVPYCNSSRICQLINDRSSYFEGNQSVTRFVKISSHVSFSMLSTLFAYAYMQNAAFNSSILALVFSFIVNIFVLTFFISLLGDIADSILLCTLVENYLNSEAQQDHSEQNKEEEPQPGYDVLPTQ